jgi:hypothetical protein
MAQSQRRQGTLQLFSAAGSANNFKALAAFNGSAQSADHSSGPIF